MQSLRFLELGFSDLLHNQSCTENLSVGPVDVIVIAEVPTWGTPRLHP